jgi:hypothetical protein
MRRDLIFVAVLGGVLTALVACSSSSSVQAPELVAVFPWDGGAEAGCVIGTDVTRVGCAMAYTITGDPSECAGFDQGGTGSTVTCQSICKSGLACIESGLSTTGANVVACQATCASPEH